MSTAGHASADGKVIAIDTGAMALLGKPPTRQATGWLPLAAVCLAYFLVILDVTIVTVANPSIAAGLHATVTSLQWVVDGYTMVFAGLLLVGGGLGDRYGGKRVFVAGLAVFTVASICCGLAPAAGPLIAARLLQGAGAALMVPTSLSLLQAAYEDKASRARAYGVWAAIGGVAAAVGPVLGGVLVAVVGWPAVFFVNVPIGVVALVATLRYVPAPEPRPASHPLLPELLIQGLGIAGLAALTGALNEAGGRGWTSSVVLVLLAAAVVLIAGFVLGERASKQPMVPLALFRRAEFSAAATVGVLLNLGFYGLLFAAPLYFTHVFGFGPLLTGLAILPLSAIVALSSAVSGRLTARLGPRIPILIGLPVGAAGLLGWLLAGTDTPYWLLVAPMIAAGFGISFTMPASTAAIMEAAPADRAGVASAVFNTGRQTGTALGVALVGSFLTAQGLVPGLHIGVLMGAAALLAATLVAALHIRTPH
jgi:DHA2 family methylenomycin A resistance protein-like MFS transporter